MVVTRELGRVEDRLSIVEVEERVAVVLVTDDKGKDDVNTTRVVVVAVVVGVVMEVDELVGRGVEDEANDDDDITVPDELNGSDEEDGLVANTDEELAVRGGVVLDVAVNVVGGLCGTNVVADEPDARLVLLDGAAGELDGVGPHI